MNKVAVFGNAGGGKSTLSQRLADITGLPWIPLDAIKYQPGGIADKVVYQKKLAVTRDYFCLDMEVLEIGCGYGVNRHP